MLALKYLFKCSNTKFCTVLSKVLSLIDLDRSSIFKLILKRIMYLEGKVTERKNQRDLASARSLSG